MKRVKGRIRSEACGSCSALKGPTVAMVVQKVSFESRLRPDTPHLYRCLHFVDDPQCFLPPPPRRYILHNLRAVTGIHEEESDKRKRAFHVTRRVNTEFLSNFPLRFHYSTTSHCDTSEIFFPRKSHQVTLEPLRSK